MKLRILAVISLLIIVGLFAFQPPVRSDKDAILSVIYHDIAIDEQRGLIYGTDYENHKLHVLKIGTYEIIDSLFLGIHPAGLDISPDGSELAVAIHSEWEYLDGAVVFVDLDSLTESGRVVPTTQNANYRGWDVRYGRVGRLYAVEHCSSGGIAYVSAIDTETKTEVGHSDFVVREEPSMDISPDNNWLYVSQPNLSSNSIYRFDISADTPIYVSGTPFGDARVEDLCVLNGNVYSSYGQIWSGDLSTLLGTFQGYDDYIECSQATQTFYTSRIGENFVRTYRVGNDRAQNYFEFPGETGTIRLNSTGTTLYVTTSAGIYSIGLQNDQHVFIPITCGRYCRPHYTNDFSTMEISPWPIVSNEYAGTRYLYGEYRFEVRQPALMYALRAPVCWHEDYDVQVQAHWQDSGTSYALVFGLNEDWSRYYLFDVSPRYEAYRLYYVSGSYAASLIGPAPSDAIKQGSEVNTLTVSYYGNRIELYINGQLVGSINHDTSYITGSTGVGLAVSSAYDKPSSEAVFDNFIIQQLDAAGNPVVDNVSIVKTQQLDPEGTSATTMHTDEWPEPDFSKIQHLP